LGFPDTQNQANHIKQPQLPAIENKKKEKGPGLLITS
jgi:hypothetical protein